MAPLASTDLRLNASGGLWGAVDRVVDRTELVADLRLHGLHLLAGRRWRELGRQVPPELLLFERRAAKAALVAPVLLAHARSAWDGPILLFKGPEVAARYPEASLRPFGDLDLLTDEPEAMQRALVAAGFHESGDPAIYAGVRHHLRPLVWPGLPLAIEIHAAPKWLQGVEPPPIGELLEAAVPSTVGVGGVLAPAPAHHAALLVAHAWAHDPPLARLIQLVDLAAVVGEAERSEVRALAGRWGIRRPWTTTVAAADAVLGQTSPPWALRLWARHLAEVRGPTVAEHDLARFLGRLWALPPHRAAPAVAALISEELRPLPGETWRMKALRTRRALERLSLRKSLHDVALKQERLEQDAAREGR